MILFNLPIIVLMLRQLQMSWPVVKDALESCITEHPEVVDFRNALDEVYYMIIRRR